MGAALGRKEEGVAALDHGVFRGIDPRKQQNFREGFDPRDQTPVPFVDCYPSPSCLLPQHNAEDAFSRTFS